MTDQRPPLLCACGRRAMAGSCYTSDGTYLPGHGRRPPADEPHGFETLEYVRPASRDVARAALAEAMTDQQAAPLTAETHCLDCGHAPHPVRTCHEYVHNGDPSNGPAYCPCATEMEAMERALLDRDRSAPSDGGLREAAQRIKDEHDAGYEPSIGAMGALFRALAATPTPAPAETKRAPCVHGNPCRESQCVEYGRRTPAPAPADLDVGRLAEAMRYVERTMQYAMGVKAPDDGPPDEWYDGYARNVVKRYAALSDSFAGVEGRTENCRTCDLTYPAGTEHRCTDGWT